MSDSEDTGTGEDGPPASSDDLFYLDDGTKDGSRVTDKNRKLKIAYTVLAALSRKQHWQIPENFCWWFLIN